MKTANRMKLGIFNSSQNVLSEVQSWICLLVVCWIFVRFFFQSDIIIKPVMRKSKTILYIDILNRNNSKSRDFMVLEVDMLFSESVVFL